jgi:hypothetical protein
MPGTWLTDLVHDAAAHEPGTDHAHANRPAVGLTRLQRAIDDDHERLPALEASAAIRARMSGSDSASRCHARSFSESRSAAAARRWPASGRRGAARSRGPACSAPRQVGDLGPVLQRLEAVGEPPRHVQTPPVVGGQLHGDVAQVGGARGPQIHDHIHERPRVQRTILVSAAGGNWKCRPRSVPRRLLWTGCPVRVRDPDRAPRTRRGSRCGQRGPGRRAAPRRRG